MTVQASRKLRHWDDKKNSLFVERVLVHGQLYEERERGGGGVGWGGGVKIEKPRHREISGPDHRGGGDVF